MTSTATVTHLGERARPARPARLAPAVADVVAAVLAERCREEDGTELLAELQRWLELCDSGRGLDDAGRTALRTWFLAAARRGVPLSAVQDRWREAVAHAFTELWARADPADVTALLRLSRWVARTGPEAERLLVDAYCTSINERREVVDQRAARAERLLAGLVDARLDPPPAPAYLVVVAAAREVPEPTAGAALSTCEADDRVTLFPVAAVAHRPRVWREAAAMHAGVRAAGAFAESARDVGAARDRARRIRDTALAIGLPPGLIGQRDLALELTLDGGPRDHLAAVLDPLDEDVQLLDTLATFYRQDLDRTRTATRLHLSRGGLSRRLERIARLTGLDPRSTRGIQVLGSALSARALVERSRAG